MISLPCATSGRTVHSRKTSSALSSSSVDLDLNVVAGSTSANLVAACDTAEWSRPRGSISFM